MAWYRNRAAWGTSDGFAPVRIVWAYFRAIRMHRALVALDTARGINLAFAGEDGAVAYERTYDDAYPPAK